MSQRRAVIVGQAQVRRNPKYDGPFEPWEPAQIMAEALRRAVEDLGAQGDASSADVFGKADVLAVVEPIGYWYDDLVSTTRTFAGVHEGVKPMTEPAGGNSPGALLGRIANTIVDGEADVVLLLGCETLFSRRRCEKEGRKPDWTPQVGPRVFSTKPFSTPVEKRHGIDRPIHAYPLLENALRADAGRTVEEHQAFLGRFMARNTRLAANNPYAWFPTEYTPEELSQPSADNRMIAFPYPKRLNAVMEVDQAAALVIMSSEEATRRGIPAHKQVAYLGGGSAEDAWSPAERIDMVSSPGISAASQAAFGHAGLGIADVDVLELYSCFPSAVELAMRALGMEPEDPRGFSVIGGLAYAGGPGNSYAMHGYAKVTEMIREAAADGPHVGLVSGLGMTATKHSYAVLSNDPARVAASDGRYHKVELPHDVIHGPELVDEVSGDATIESYTVIYDREGKAERSIFVLRLDDGRRTVANGDCSDAEVAALTTGEGVGRRGHVIAGSAVDNVPNRFVLGGEG